MRYGEETEGGPGNIFSIHSKRPVDNVLSPEEPLTLKALKYNN
jgi:hypothetical protein